MAIDFFCFEKYPSSVYVCISSIEGGREKRYITRKGR